MRQFLRHSILERNGGYLVFLHDELDFGLIARAKMVLQRKRWRGPLLSLYQALRTRVLLRSKFQRFHLRPEELPKYQSERSSAYLADESNIYWNRVREPPQ